jgi:hypothetical protein
MNIRTLLAIFTVVSMIGCASGDETDPRPVVRNTPLALDPSNPVELGRWWSNGTLLLEMNDDARYRMYPSLNRYQSPREFGRWDRLTYASVQLQPYAHEGPNPQAYRAKLEPDAQAPPDKGGVALALPGLAAFRPLDRVPSVVEDRLIGTWTSPQGVLELDAGMQYRFTATEQGASIMSKHVGHRGTWRVQRSDLLLQPAASNLGPFVVRIENPDSADTIALVNDGSPMQRVTDDMTHTPLTGVQE